MRRISKFSIPAALALFAMTAHPQGADPQKDPNPSRSTKTTSSQQKDVTQEQRIHQSTFDPKPVSDSELKKAVNDVNKASTFMGMNIQNLQNEKLGSVKDLVFDPDSGKISYAVISVGGVLGVGDKLIAVPIHSLRPQPGEKYLVLNMSKDELTSAPGLTKNNWPSLNDPALGGPAGSERGASSINRDATTPSTESPAQSTETSKSEDSSTKRNESKSDQNK